MLIFKKILIVLALLLSGVLCVCNVKSHNKYKQLDEYIKGTLAFDFLLDAGMCIYLIVKVVTM